MSEPTAVLGVPRTGRGDVIGVGYQGVDAVALVAGLKARGVTTLVDVRLNPVSRKRGLSKRSLQASLAESGIDYVHLPELGNPQDNRAGFAASAASEADAAHARFREVLESPAARSALGAIESLQAVGRVALLCFESDEELCHRHLILHELTRRASETQR